MNYYTCVCALNWDASLISLGRWLSEPKLGFHGNIMELLLCLYLLLFQLDHELCTENLSIGKHLFSVKLKGFSDSNTEGRWTPALFQFSL